MHITRPGFREVLSWTAIAIAVALVLVSPWPTGSQYQQHWTVLASLAVLLGAIALVIRGLDPQARPRIDPVLLALGSLAAVYALQLVPMPAGLVGILSPARLRLAQEAAEAVGAKPPNWLPLTACLKCTRDSLLHLVAYVSLFYTAATVFYNKKRWMPILVVAVVAGVPLAVFGMWEMLAGIKPMVTATYTSHNRFANLMAITGAAALGLCLVARWRRPKTPAPAERPPALRPGTILGNLARCFRGAHDAWWLAAAVIIEIALVLTLSRLGIVAAFAAGLLTVAVFARRKSLWAALAVLLALVALNALLAVDPVLARYSLLFEGDRLGIGRAQCWRMALPLLRDFPLLGSGAGTFRHVFPMYQLPTLSGWWKFAHNDYLNLLCDAGVLGFVALSVAVVFLLKQIVPLRSSRDPVTRGIAVAAFLALTTTLFHSLGDFPLRQPANAAIFSMLIGIAYGRARARSRREDKASSSPRWVLPVYVVAAIALCVVCLPVLFRLRLSGALHAEAARLPVARTEETEQGSLQRRLVLLERAAARDAWDAESRYEAARTLVRMAVESSDPDAARDAGLKARRLLAEGRSASPLDPRAYYLEAILDARQGRVGSADLLMRNATKLAPAWPDVAYQVGRYFLLRWQEARRQGHPGFALSRWKDVPDHKKIGELATRMSESLSLAARSVGTRYAAVALVIDGGLSAREIDDALLPDGKINLALANALARRKQHELACDRFELALTSGDLPVPTTGVHVAYARSLLVTGEIKAALDQFDAAIRAARLDATSGEPDRTIRDLSRLRARSEDAAAIADFWAARATELGEEPALLLARGRAELAAGRDAPGFEHLLEYAKKTRDAGVFAELARLELKRGRLKPAAAFAARATDLAPKVASHHGLLARTLVRLGDREGARSSFRAALLLKPRTVWLVRELVALETRAGRPEMAISAWSAFLAAGGDAAAAHEGMADVYLRIDDRERAAEELLKAIKAKPSDKRLRKKLEEACGHGVDGARLQQPAVLP